jgi:hypothetical protein
MTPVNIERLEKLGRLMERTIADRDGVGAVIPLPPPPPPLLPAPPTYEEEEPEPSGGCCRGARSLLVRVPRARVDGPGLLA